MTRRYTHLAPGQGMNYDWENDHTFVKVSTQGTGGAYTLMEDNLKPQFALGLHRHDTHAETFYILDGEVDFYLDDGWVIATPGATIHIPPGTPHACRARNGKPARFLMIYQPAGFDAFLAELAQMSEADFADSTKMDALNQKYDIIPMGPVPAHPDDDRKKT